MRWTPPPSTAAAHLGTPTIRPLPAPDALPSGCPPCQLSSESGAGSRPRHISTIRADRCGCSPVTRKTKKMSSINGAVVLVTGANGGIGTHFVHDALARGASKVYATARTPRTWEDARIVPLTLDVTDSTSIQAAVDAARDVTVLINNAGASVASPGILTHTDAEIRSNVETNFLGPLFLARAFAPMLSA